MELRIRQLTQLLEHAKVGEAPADDGVVAPGMVVTDRLRRRPGRHHDLPARLPRVRDLRHRDLLPAVPAGVGGRAARRSATTASYELPNGKRASVKILEAKPYQG